MKPLNIDLRKLQHAVVLAEMRSFVRAAIHLNMTQSALSRSIQSIEATISVRLFDRDRTGIRPTAHGELFLERARALLREAQSLDEMLHGLAGKDAGVVRIGLGPAVAGIAMPALLTQMLNERPDVRLSVLVQSPPTLLSELIADRLDFIACSETLLDRSSPVVLRRIATVSTWLLARASHPLVGQAVVSRVDIARYPLIAGSFSEGYASGFTDFGDLTLICDDYRALHDATLASDAIWFSPPQAAREALADGRLVALPSAAPGALDYPVVLVRRRGRTLGRSTQHVERLLTSLVTQKLDHSP